MPEDRPASTLSRAVAADDRASKCLILETRTASELPRISFWEAAMADLRSSIPVFSFAEMEIMLMSLLSINETNLFIAKTFLLHSAFSVICILASDAESLELSSVTGIPASLSLFGSTADSTLTASHLLMIIKTL